MVAIILAAAVMLVLAVFFGYILGWANRRFHVEADPKVEAVLAALPGANCGACGFAGCGAYAEAVAKGSAAIDKCGPGGPACVEAIAKILGIEVEQTFPYRPVVHCGARYDDRLKKNPYRGELTCSGANMISGIQGCAYGCLGLGDCQVACPYDAIHIIDGLAVVDYDKCIGCKACEKACPRHIISMVPFKDDRMVVVACSNKDFGKDVRNVCKVGCIGCKVCTRLSQVFKMEGNLAVVDYSAYSPDKLPEIEKALEKCPMKRILYVGKPSAKDLAAVAEEKLPSLVQPQFQTTVDKTDWHG